MPFLSILLSPDPTRRELTAIPWMLVLVRLRSLLYLNVPVPVMYIWPLTFRDVHLAMNIHFHTSIRLHCAMTMQVLQYEFVESSAFLENQASLFETFSHA